MPKIERDAQPKSERKARKSQTQPNSSPGLMGKRGPQAKAKPEGSVVTAAASIASNEMHGDLQKSAKDSTLEHSLFAAFNTD